MRFFNDFDTICSHNICPLPLDIVDKIGKLFITAVEGQHLNRAEIDLITDPLIS